MSPLKCRSCSAEVPGGSKFCAHCGARLVPNGVPDRPVIVREEPDDDEDLEPGALVRAGIWFLDFFPGLMQPGLVLLSLIAVAAGGYLIQLGIGILMLGAPFAGVAIGAFGVVCYGTAWCWVLYGYICLPSEAMAEFDGKKWLVLSLAIAGPVAGVWALVNVGG